ncbi:bone morphogenetic protein 7-like [Saccostrea echinata]|uniref:bone morphogenetic protein 7-like n=1 Tax=Saccostrea echinata TaxID=191078 RepID=UPI002A81C3B9|nr:bone morphogenetic protein 7-like [Saccostrea echinata]
MADFFLCLWTALFFVRTILASSAYYVDNGIGQTEKVHEMNSRDKRELQHEILTLLGLHQRPKPKSSTTKDSAPTFMLSLYNSITSDNGVVRDDGSFHTSHNVTVGDSVVQPIEGTDVIISFVNKARRVPHLRHEKDRTFFFDFSDVTAKETVVGAELRLYKEKAKKWKKNHDFQIQIYMIRQGKDPEDKILESVSNVTVQARTEGWITFNLTRAAELWTIQPETNLGLFMKVLFIIKGREIDPNKLGIISYKGSEDKRPFMVGFFSSQEMVYPHRTRTALRRRRELYSYREEKEKYQDYNLSRHKRGAGRWPCQRRSLYVKFRDLGWQSWIIAPDGYHAFFCEGECSFPIGNHVNATNHAIVQTLVHMYTPYKAPSPGCAPSKLSAQSVLYFDDDGNVVLKKFPKMIVTSCGCH